jgi:hypothetical protein
LTFVSEGLHEQLKIIEMTMSCYSGFAHYLGDSPKNVPSENYIDELAEKTIAYKSKLPNAPDFVHSVKNYEVWCLYHLNELIRKLETEYVGWMYHDRVIRNIYDWFVDRPEEIVELGQNILYMSALLNRMSKFVDAAARHENLMRGLPETYWQAKAIN